MNISDRVESKRKFANQRPEEKSAVLLRAERESRFQEFLHSQVLDLCQLSSRSQRRERRRQKFFVLSRSQLATLSQLHRRQLDPAQLRLGLDPDPVQSLWDLLRRSALLSSLSQDRASALGRRLAVESASSVMCPHAVDQELARAQEHDRLHRD